MFSFNGVFYKSNNDKLSKCKLIIENIYFVNPDIRKIISSLILEQNFDEAIEMWEEKTERYFIDIDPIYIDNADIFELASKILDR